MAFRKTIINVAKPYKVNKASYLKPGSAIAKSKKEDHLFDCMFEIVLDEDYEDNYDYRKVEWDEKKKRDKAEFDRWAGGSKAVSRNARSVKSRSSSKKSDSIEIKANSNLGHKMRTVQHARELPIARPLDENSSKIQDS